MDSTLMTTHPTGRDYFRVSKDDSGRERSAAEQEADNRQVWAGQLAFNGESYAEAEAISASRFATKSRGGFDRLMSDLRTGRFGADTLVLWEPSRGSRKASEWCELIELCEAAGVSIAVTSHARVYDPANGRDRRSLQEDAVDSEYESYKTSERVCRAMNANARQGRGHGVTPFGYTRRYDPMTRQLIAQEPDPDEGPLVAELFHRLEKGHSLKAIERDWAERGITTRGSAKRPKRPFAAQGLRSLALSPVYALKRVHHGSTTKGDWPMIPGLSLATVHAVQRMLNERKVGSARSGRAKHLLSGGIVVCDVCSGPLAVEFRDGRPTYVCQQRKCVRIRKAELDDLAERAIIAYLSRKDHYDALGDDGDDVALAKAREGVARIRAERDQLYDNVEAGEVSETIATRRERGILARLAEAEQREQELSVPSRLRQLIEPGADVERRWRAAPISAKRDIARIVLSPEFLGELRIRRAERRGAAIEDRIVWKRAEA